MQFRNIGISYKDAKLDIRDRVSFTDRKKITFLEEAEQLGVSQCMILSTCNRSEVFYFADGEDGMSELYRDSFSDVEMEDCLRRREGREAMSYFFRIAAGLESLVLGEDQILGQLGDAFEFSKAVGYSGKELNKVVRDAVTCAKKIKTELKISEKPLSVSYIGIKEVERLCGIKGRRALVIGSGKTAALALRYLYDHHVGRVVVCSRTLAHARALREEFPELGVEEYQKRYELLEDCDIVITATLAPHTILRKEEFAAAHRKGRSCVLLDLAAPRDIDPDIGKLPGISLIDMDALERISDENRQEREKLVELSKERVLEAVEETEGWLRSSEVDGTIRSLQQRCDDIVSDIYDYLERTIPMEPRERRILKKMLRASLRRLLREPILELKQLDSAEKQQEYQKVVRALFQIDE